MNFISYRKSELYDRVVDKHGVFEYSYDFMVFLAVIGYREGKPDRQDYEGSDEKETRGQIGVENFFANDLYRVVTACIAFQDTENPAALVDPELQAEKLAQYASGGLQIAEERFGQTTGDPTDAVMNYIKGQQGTETYEGTLDEIVKAFDEEMIGVDDD